MEPIVATVVDGYRAVHGKLREVVRAMDEAALNWAPAAEANSVAALVVHTIGSEQEVLRTVRAVAGERDRPAEFRAQATSADELVARLDEADRYLDELASGITAEDLVATRPRGDRPAQSGLHWLITNYGHAREHLAHVELTNQLYEAQKGG
jgi:hypothetical protein